jgi:hypothetical protein
MYTKSKLMKNKTMKNKTMKNKTMKNKTSGGSCLMTPSGAQCQIVNPHITTGGKYTPTPRNKYYLSKYLHGQSIGFTMTSSLKAKGLIPRSNGKKRVSNKYK